MKLKLVPTPCKGQMVKSFKNISTDDHKNVKKCLYIIGESYYLNLVTAFLKLKTKSRFPLPSALFPVSFSSFRARTNITSK